MNPAARTALHDDARQAARVLSEGPQQLSALRRDLAALSAARPDGFAQLRDRAATAAAMLSDGQRAATARHQHYVAHRLEHLSPMRARKAFTALERPFRALANAPTLQLARSLPLEKFQMTFVDAYAEQDVQRWLAAALNG